ncbi:MAG: hypothetical protein GY910_00870 [bacterium]|nr:hypothetical protein [bacterium]
MIGSKSGGVSKGQVRSSKTPMTSLAAVKPTPFAKPQVAPTKGPLSRRVRTIWPGIAMTPRLRFDTLRPNLRAAGRRGRGKPQNEAEHEFEETPMARWRAHSRDGLNALGACDKGHPPGLGASRRRSWILESIDEKLEKL